MDGSSIARRGAPEAVLELVLALIIAFAAGYLAFAMPSLVQRGGMEEAHDFIHLSSVFFPRLSFGLTSVIGFYLVFRNLRGMQAAGFPRIAFDGRKYLRVLVMTALVIAYGSLLSPLGYGIATLIAVAAMTYFLGLRSWLALAAFSIATPVITRFVFERLLAISLPLSRYEALAVLEQDLMRILSSLLIAGR